MSTYERIASTEIERLIPRNDDPPAEPEIVLIYVRPVDGVLRTCARFPNGSVSIIL